MKKSEIRQVPEYFDKYIHLVQDIDLMEAFEKSLRSLTSLDLKILKEIGNHMYAPGK